MSKREPTYRILFTQNDKTYEIYAQYISEDTLMGFIEAENIIFNEAGSILLDPNEERLKEEFKGVKRSYIPLHTIIRIDEVEGSKPRKIKLEKSDNVSQFPPQLIKKTTLKNKK